MIGLSSLKVDGKLCDPPASLDSANEGFKPGGLQKQQQVRNRTGTKAKRRRSSKIQVQVLLLSCCVDRRSAVQERTSVPEMGLWFGLHRKTSHRNPAAVSSGNISGAFRHDRCTVESLQRCV